MAFVGRFLLKPYFRRIIKHMPTVTFFVLVGLLCFAVSAQAERTSAPPPEVEELRYDLEPLTPPPAPPPADPLPRPVYREAVVQKIRSFDLEPEKAPPRS